MSYNTAQIKTVAEKFLSSKLVDKFVNELEMHPGSKTPKNEKIKKAWEELKVKYNELRVKYNALESAFNFESESDSEPESESESVVESEPDEAPQQTRFKSIDYDSESESESEPEESSESESEPTNFTATQRKKRVSRLKKKNPDTADKKLHWHVDLWCTLGEGIDPRSLGAAIPEPKVLPDKKKLKKFLLEEKRKVQKKLYTSIIEKKFGGSGNIIENIIWSIRNGANVNFNGDGENTPLMIAAEHGELEIVELLLSKGADVNIVDSCGYTALMIASAFGEYKVVKRLLNNGADVNVADQFGYTALTIASNGESKLITPDKHVSSYKYDKIVALLRKSKR